MFEWQTDDHETWEGEDGFETAVSPNPNQAPRKKRFMFASFLLLFVVLLSGFIKFRTDQAITLTEQNLLASHRFVQTAAQQQDSDLLNTILSARDVVWVESQQQLVESGLLYDRPQFLLQLQPINASFEPTSFEISADLSAAEVMFEQVYDDPWFDEPVHLLHTAVYRQGRNAWLYAPPTATFWGEWQVETYSRLKLTYPLRDEAYAEALGLSMNRTLVGMCETIADIACPANWQLELRFDHHPNTLNNLLTGDAYLSRGIYSLPTPTLMGLPIDSAGEVFLSNEYHRYALMAAITELVGYECCQQSLLYQALLEKQISEIGTVFGGSPPPPTRYHQLLLLDNAPQFLSPLWLQSSPKRDWSTVNALVEFLFLESDTSLVQMMQLLKQVPDYEGWLHQLLPQDDATIEAAWDAFIVRRAKGTVSSLALQNDSPLLPQPVAGFQLVCETTDLAEGLFEYRFDRQAFQLVEADIRPFTRTCLVDDCTPGVIKTPPVSPNGRMQFVTELQSATELGFSSIKQFETLNVQRDGTEQLVGFGHSPFWFNDTFVGYIADVGESNELGPISTLQRVNIFEQTVHTIVTSEALYATMPEAERAAQLIVQDVRNHPQFANQLVVKALSSPANSVPQFYFLLTLNNSFSTVESIRYLGRYEYKTDFVFPENGRYVQIMDLTARWVTLVDLEALQKQTVQTNGRVSFAPFWTPDNQSFLQFRANQMLLFNPTTQETVMIPHGFNFCVEPVWVE